ncbi:MAG: succinate dehydrogenase flavoprotein subunit [Nitrospirae bacterium]|nr:succinate dehydrogenase flavoprotein subunit [Nitrospirota bacterium]
MKQANIIVIGGGLAGLMTTIKIAEAGQKVQLFAMQPVRRSHSVCAQGGINAAINLKGEGDSIWTHFDDTVYGGDFLANQPLVKRMCEAAPDIVELTARMGVMYNRTPEGHLDFRRFGGTKFHRTAFAGTTTGQQLVYALDEQVRRHEAEGLVTKFEGWELLSPVIHNGACRGITAMNLNTMEVRAFPADAVVAATGGIGAIFGLSTNSLVNTGSAASALYQAGAVYANPEFVQVHPTAMPGEDKLRLISESARGEGGRVWVPRDGKPWYFLEDWYPAYGNLVPRDIASRAIFKVVHELGLGVDGGEVVYMDISHLNPRDIDRKLYGIAEIYERFSGDDPRKVPMRVFPAVHYNMGGLWVDDNMATNVPGLYAAGEAEYQHHGANRLGANSLVSCIFDGMVAGPAAVAYAEGLQKRSGEISSGIFEAEANLQRDINADILNTGGTENPFDLFREMGDLMRKNVTVIRKNDDLKKTDEKLAEMLERCGRLNVVDKSPVANTSLVFARELKNMLILARAITVGALMRDESRGAHYKPEYPMRDDAGWLKTTRASFTPDGPEISYEPVDVSLIVPRERHYDVD